MNPILKICAGATLVVGLAACDQLGIGGDRGRDNVAAPANTVITNAADANASGGKDPAAGGNMVSAGSTPATPGDGSVTTAFLLGRWTDTGDCTNTVEFRADGTFVTSAGARGTWFLNGNQLTFRGQRAITATVTATGPHAINLTQQDGSVGSSTRCTG